MFPFSSFILFPSDLMTIFSVMFGFISFFSCIYYRFLVCGYHEVYIWQTIYIWDYLSCWSLNFKCILTTLRFFLFVFLKLFIYLFIIYLSIHGCVGSSFLCEGFLQLRQAGATLHRGARASHYRGLSCCGAQAPDAQAQQLWLMGPAAPRHVGSSQTRAPTCVPCIGRQTLNHCATREVPNLAFLFPSLHNYCFWHHILHLSLLCIP